MKKVFFNKNKTFIVYFNYFININDNKSVNSMFDHNFRLTPPNWIIIFVMFVIVRIRFIQKIKRKPLE